MGIPTAASSWTSRNPTLGGRFSGQSKRLRASGSRFPSRAAGSCGVAQSVPFRELYLAAVVVGVGLGHPVPQARLADAEVLGDLGDRCGALAGELDGALAELQGVWCRHADILPGGRGHLRSGVRATWASSWRSARARSLAYTAPVA